MSGLRIIFDDKKIKKNISNRSRTPFTLNDIDVNRIVISKEVAYGTKSSIKYLNFQGKETPNGDSSYKCLLLIMLDSVVKVGKKYYPQVFLEECKYVKRKNKMFNYINDDLEMTSSGDDDDEPDSESDSDSNSDSNN